MTYEFLMFRFYIVRVWVATFWPIIQLHFSLLRETYEQLWRNDYIPKANNEFFMLSETIFMFQESRWKSLKSTNHLT